MKTYTNNLLVMITLLLFSTEKCFSSDLKNHITTEKNSKTGFAIAESGNIAPILVSNEDFPSILYIAKHLQADLKSVTGTEPLMFNSEANLSSSNIIIVGTFGKSPLIDQLVRDNKIDSLQLSGKWEKFIHQVIHNPFPGVDKALVIAGSDMRGTIYGIYELSNQIGISPWQWWSGVPAEIQSSLYVNSDLYTQGEPKIKYRGFYLDLKKLPMSKGNSQVSYSFQEKAIELILRMKGNYLLPENFGSADFDENSQIGFLAKKYGVFIKKTSDYVPLTKFDSNNTKIDVIDFKEEDMKSSGPNAAYKPYTEIVVNEKDFWTQNTQGIHFIKEKEALGKIKPGSDNTNYGIYYNYDSSSSDLKWYNSNQIEQVWQELNSAYEYGFDKLWIVNVGAIKHMELPIEFFLDFSWNPEVWTVDKLDSYYKAWSKESFGNQYHNEIATILKKYTTFNSRTDLSLKSKTPYSLTNYKEAETVVNEYNVLAQEVVTLYNKIDAKYKNAFYQIVVFPVVASANINELMVTIEKNKLYKKQGRAVTNDLAQNILELSVKDIKIREDYNRVLSSSNLSFYIKKAFLTKKDEQINNYEINKPERLALPYEGLMGIAVEGTENAFTKDGDVASLPEFDPFNKQIYAVEIFNTGEKALTFKTKASTDWLKIDTESGPIDKQTKILVSVDWNKAPKGIHEGKISIKSEENEITVFAKINYPNYSFPDNFKSFVESNGYISIKPENYSAAYAQKPFKWVSIPNVGRSLSGMMASPSVSDRVTDRPEGTKLEYNLHMNTTGTFKIHSVVSPSFSYDQDLKFAISIDNETPQIISLNDNNYLGKCKNITISENNGIRILTTTHSINNIGEHTLTFWMVDPGVVLQKIVVETGELKPSYFGPPQSSNSIK